MSTEIDSLQIEITAKSQNADAAIEKLIDKLSILEKQLTSISATAAKTSKGVDKATEGTNNTTRKLDGTTTAVVRTSKTIEKATPGLAKYGLALSGLTAIAGGAIAAFKGFNEMVKKLSASTEQYASVMQSINFSNIMAESMPSSIAQLSGLNFDTDTRLLESTGMVSFGVSIKDISQYNATLSTFAKTLGLSEVASVNLSDAFVQLAGDISALTGEDYATIGRKLQDALTGSTDALKDYGIALSDNILQQTAYKYGITEAISSMTSAEKAQIAFLTVMEKTQGMFGSQASSVNSLASMFAQWRANLSDITILLGQSFAPIVAGVLPYLNAFAILLKDVLSSFARLMGFEGIGQPIANISTSVSGVEDAFKGATSAAKKLKTVTLGIDELNINSPQESAGGSVGVGGSSFDLSSQIAEMTSQYNDMVDEVFANAQSKVQAILDRIRGAQKLMGEGFSGAFVADVQGAVNGFDRIEEVWNNIGSDPAFSASVENMKNSAFTAIGSVAGAHSSILWSQIDGAVNGTASGLEEKTPYITSNLTAINDSFATFSDNITSLSGAMSEIGTAFESEGFRDIFSTLTQFATVTTLEPLEKLSGFFTDLSGIVIAPIVENSDELKQALESIFSIASDLISPLESVSDVIAGSSINYEDTWLHKFMEFLKTVAVEDFSTKLNGINIVLSGISSITEYAADGLDDVITTFGRLSDKIEKFWNENIASLFKKENVIKTINGVKEGFAEVFLNTFNIVVELLNKVTRKINESLTFKWDAVNIMGVEVVPAGSVKLANIPEVPKISAIPKFERGGFPRESSLFFAGENGVPEILGTVGGRTAVAGGAEITGIRDAVYQSAQEETALLREQNELLRQLLAKDTSVNIGDRDIARANARGSRSLGYALIT